MEKVLTTYKEVVKGKKLTNLSYFLAFYTMLCLLNMLETGYFGFNMVAKTAQERFVDAFLGITQLVLWCRFVWKEKDIIIIAIGILTSGLIERICNNLLVHICR